MERKIIHLNIADFSVAVERLVDSSLRTRPLIIAPQTPRATVYDMSEEAYRDGVRKDMPLIQARKRCRHALILPPAPERYEKAIRCCIRHALPFTPQVERAPGAGHLFLDVTGTHRLFGPPPDIGWRIRNSLRRELGLDPIWSVAPNKLVAKVASRIVKPAGEYVVAEGEERDFLAPLPLSLLPFVPRKAHLRLWEVGVRSIGQAAALSPQDLCLLCGYRVESFYRALQGVDRTPVGLPSTPDQRFFFQHHFAPDSNCEKTVRHAALDLARQAAHALRRQKLDCRRLAFTLIYSDSIRITRQASCKHITDDGHDLEQMTLTALFRAWRRRVRLRTVQLACTLVRRSVRQLSLFHGVNIRQQRQRALQEHIDTIHEKFGRTMLCPGGPG